MADQYEFLPSPMTFTVKNGTTTFPGALVKISASEEIDLCGAGEGNLCIGLAAEAVVGDGTLKCPVIDRKTPGIHQLKSAGAVAAGAAIYCAAGGKADDAASGLKIGTSVKLCSNANELFPGVLNSDQQ